MKCKYFAGAAFDGKKTDAFVSSAHVEAFSRKCCCHNEACIHVLHLVYTDCTVYLVSPQGIMNVTDAYKL